MTGYENSWDLIYINDGEYEGYELINPEGLTFERRTVLLQEGIGRGAIISEGERRLEEVQRQRFALERERW